MSWLAYQWDTMIHSGMPWTFWIKPRWFSKDVPDQSGKVVLVTGGNSGTGYATCKTMYEKGAKVYLCCRDVNRGKQAVEDIKKGGIFGPVGIEYPKSPPNLAKAGTLEVLELDLADLNSISRFIEDFKTREKRLDILFANAGVMASTEGQFTKQGYTLQFGTNTLGHQRLSSGLLPLLLSSAKSDPAHLPRVIHVSSAGHTLAPKNGFDPESVVRPANQPPSDQPQRGPKELNKWVEYGQSKWGNIAVANYVHWLYGPSEGAPKQQVKGERQGEGEIISIALHPGVIATNLSRHLSFAVFILKYMSWIAPLLMKTAEDGASNQIWAATCPEDQARKLSGEYIAPFQHIGIARPDTKDPENVQRLWDWCEAQGKRHE